MASIYKRGPLWYVKFVNPETGKRIPKSTGILVADDKKGKKAAIEGAKIEMAYLVSFGKVQSSVSSILLYDALDQFFADLQNRDMNDLTNIGQKIRKLKGKRQTRSRNPVEVGCYAMDNKLCSSLTKTDVIRLIRARRAEGLANTSLMYELGVLERALRHTRNGGYEVSGLDLPQIRKEEAVVHKTRRELRKEEVRYLSEDEEARLLAELDPMKALEIKSAAARAEAMKGRRDCYDLVVLLLHTACRTGEVEKLKWENVDFDEGTVTIFRSKTGESAVLPMTGKARQILQARERDRLGNDVYVFTNEAGDGSRNYAPGAIKKAAMRAGITDWHVHLTRSTAASKVAQSGKVELHAVQALLGQKSIRTTQRHYANMLKNKQAASALQVLDALDPVSEKEAKNGAFSDDSADTKSGDSHQSSDEQSL